MSDEKERESELERRRWNIIQVFIVIVGIILLIKVSHAISHVVDDIDDARCQLKVESERPESGRGINNVLNENLGAINECYHGRHRYFNDW